MKTIQMPSFGADMEQGVITQWLVEPGDTVNKGDIIAVVETHKGAIELDVYEPGVVDALLWPLNRPAPVGTPIARIRSFEEASQDPTIEPTDALPIAGEESDTFINEAPAEPSFSEFSFDSPTTDSPSLSDPLYRSPEASTLRSTPAARKLAEMRGIELDEIAAANHTDTIHLDDVEQAIQKQNTLEQIPPIEPVPTTISTPELKPAERFDPATMREAIAATVARSKREVPHYYLSLALDITRLREHLNRYNQGCAIDQRLLLAAPLLCAIARQLAKTPQLNGHYEQGSYQTHNSVHLANATNLRGGGLIMPVIRDAQALTTPQLMAQINSLVDKARQGILKHSELNGATCSVSSIGERGADTIYGVIYPPQVAIIGLGQPRREPKVIEDSIQIRELITATLSADHRVSDGRLGANFLHQLNKQLQQPEELWTEPNSSSAL